MMVTADSAKLNYPNETRYSAENFNHSDIAKITKFGNPIFKKIKLTIKHGLTKTVEVAAGANAPQTPPVVWRPNFISRCRTDC